VTAEPNPPVQLLSSTPTLLLALAWLATARSSHPSALKRAAVTEVGSEPPVP